MSVFQNISTQPSVKPDADSTQSRTDKPAPKNSFSGNKVWNYIKSRFNQDNWFGSLVTPLMIYVNYNTLMSARARKVNDVPKPDGKRAFSAQVQMVEATWSFFSARGGKFPEGKTVWQRVINAIRHPQISSAQFGYLALLPAMLTNNWANLDTGLKAHGIGLKSGETAYKPEKIRLYSGIYQIISYILAGVGHFKNHENKMDANTEQKAHQLLATVEKEDHSIRGAIEKMWRYDRILLVSSFVHMFAPFFGGIESWTKSKRSRAEAIYLARGTLINCLITAAVDIYTVQRLAKGNYSAQGNGSVVQEEAKADAPENFAKIPSHKQWGAEKLRQNHTTSFVQQISSPPSVPELSP